MLSDSEASGQAATLPSNSSESGVPKGSAVPASSEDRVAAAQTSALQASSSLALSSNRPGLSAADAETGRALGALLSPEADASPANLAAQETGDWCEPKIGCFDLASWPVSCGWQSRHMCGRCEKISALGQGELRASRGVGPGMLGDRFMDARRLDAHTLTLHRLFPLFSLSHLGTGRTCGWFRPRSSHPLRRCSEDGVC